MKSVTGKRKCLHCDQPVLVGQSFCCRGCEVAFGAIQTIFGDEKDGNLFYELGRGGLRSPTSRAEMGSLTPLLKSVEEIDNISSAEWYLEGVHCRACVWLVDQMPRAIDGVVSARTDISSNLLRIKWDSRQTTVEEIVGWLRPLGYTPHPTATMKENKGLVSVGISTILAMNTMMVSVTSYGGLTPENDFEVWRFLSLAAGIMGSASLYLFRFRIYRLIKSVRLKTLPVDLPIVLGMVAAWFASWLHLVQGSGELWFDAITVLVALLIATEWYTDQTRKSIGQFTQVEFSIVPEFTKHIDGRTLRREEIEVGDEIFCELGNAFSEPVLITDGVALQNMVLDRSVQTGESLPVKVEIGGFVFAGDRALSSEDRKFLYRATTRYEDSRFALLLETLRSPDYLDSPVIDRAERLSALFVKIILGLALVSTGLSVAFVGDYGAVIALLIVACPCGLAIATPLSYAIGMAQIRRKGVLLKGANAIDILDQATDIIFDKTGTLTNGQFGMQRYEGNPEYLRMAGALQAFSIHPIATAFNRDVSGLKVENVVSDRLGVSGDIGGVSYRVCQSIQSSNVDGFVATGLFLVDENRELATFFSGDALRRESEPVISRLKEDGMRVHILSGDSEKNVASLAQKLDVNNYRFGVSPEEKATYIRNLKEDGKIVLFLGDGTNDALACLEADASFVVKGASPITFTSSEGLLDSRNLMTFYDAKRFAGKVRKRTQLALLWALAYNVVMLFACASGFVTPLVAAIAMPLSSVILVLITTGPENILGFEPLKPLEASSTL